MPLVNGEISILTQIDKLSEGQNDTLIISIINNYIRKKNTEILFIIPQPPHPNPPRWTSSPRPPYTTDTAKIACLPSRAVVGKNEILGKGTVNFKKKSKVLKNIS